MTTQRASSTSARTRARNRRPYSTTASGSCAEHGPTTTNSRGSDPSSTRLTWRRASATRNTPSAPSGTASASCMGLGTGSVAHGASAWIVLSIVAAGARDALFPAVFGRPARVDGGDDDLFTEQETQSLAAPDRARDRTLLLVLARSARARLSKKLLWGSNDTPQ